MYMYINMTLCKLVCILCCVHPSHHISLSCPQVCAVNLNYSDNGLFGLYVVSEPQNTGKVYYVYTYMYMCKYYIMSCES